VGESGSVSVCRSQALIHAPADRVWDLVGQPNRHPEWWPRVIEVRGERFDEGSAAEQPQPTENL
jgi:uncharacterized protein YndB with AHSA1/START domain